MEHLIQIAVSVDDETIKNEVKEYALKTITTDLKKSVEKELYAPYWKGTNTPLKNLMSNVISEIVKENKDMIIEEAIKNVATSVRRSITCKNAVTALKETGDES